jgi:hypothetical protein
MRPALWQSRFAGPVASLGTCRRVSGKDPDDEIFL